MRAKRFALQLAMAGAAVIGLLAGMAQPAMASTGATTTAKITPLAATSSCTVTGLYNHLGAKICGTNEVDLAWGSSLAESVVIGTTFKVYHDTGTGWSVLQNGTVLSSATPTSLMGVMTANEAIGYDGFTHWVISVTIAVLGTAGHYFCNSKSDGGNWRGWTTTNCPQHY